MKERAKKWYAENTDRAKENGQKWKKENPTYLSEWKAHNAEHVQETQKQWRKANAESLQRYEKERYAADAEVFRAKTRAWTAAHPEAPRANHLRSSYDMSLDEYAYLLDRQNGACATCRLFCEANKVLSVDHDHATGNVRGLLCNKCNVALGCVRDNPTTLRNLAEYLEKHLDATRVLARLSARVVSTSVCNTQNDSREGTPQPGGDASPSNERALHEHPKVVNLSERGQLPEEPSGPEGE